MHLQETEWACVCLHPAAQHYVHHVRLIGVQSGTVMVETNGPYVLLGMTNKLKSPLQWDAQHQGFPNCSRLHSPDFCHHSKLPRNLTHRKGLWWLWVLGLQVHNQVEPLLLGLLLGVEWQRQKSPGKGVKERPKVWVFLNQQSKDLPPAATSKQHVPGDQDFIKWTFRVIQHPNPSSLSNCFGQFRGASVQGSEFAQKAEWVV